ncbi:MAG: SCO family protein [Rubricoccaceae bacterium]|nr:SCO family protein [Rubricoccaceae bacterium]
MTARRARLSLLLAAAVLTAAGSAAQVARGPSQALGQNGQVEPPSVEVTEHLGERVSPDLVFTNSAGEAVRFGDLLGERPVLLSFSYHTCPMLCSLVLDGVAEALGETDLRAGEDFAVVNVSVDPRDTPERAAEAKAKYVAQVSAVQPDLAEHWHFLTGEEAAVRQLAREAGFGYAWDEATQQYAHQGVLVFLSPTGKITRYLYGIGYPPRDVRLALVEAGDGTVGSTLDRLILTCFQYDADARSYTPVILNIMKLGGGLLLVVLAIFFVPLWLRERARTAGPDALGPIAGLDPAPSDR